MNTGEKIRELRLAKGLSMEELGNKIGVQRSAINKYEKGRVDIKRSTLVKLADALGVAPADLLDDTSENDMILIEVNKLNPEQKERLLHYIKFLQNEEVV